MVYKREDNMEWKEFCKLINVAWKIDKKNRNMRYNNIYAILNEVQPDNDNLVLSLKADCESEIQATSILTFLATMFTIAIGFLSTFLNQELKNDNLKGIVVDGSLIIFLITIIGIIIICLVRIIKKYKFILCVIDNFEKNKCSKS
jgi:hypothetical protein